MHRAGEWSNFTNQDEIWHWLDIQNWVPIALGHGLGPISHFWSLAVEEQFYSYGHSSCGGVPVKTCRLSAGY
jgi:peptidoglycan/LPS O-acetylase OafA/YrhL